MATRERALTLRVLAKCAHVSPHTVLYYERRGLLPKPSRSTAGYRLFSHDSIRRIHFIKRAQALGFSLREVKDLQALTNAHATCADVREHVMTKIAAIDAKLRFLRSARRTLLSATERCDDRRPAAECPILDLLLGDDEDIR